jgi:hypothetical protein
MQEIGDDNEKHCLEKYLNMCYSRTQRICMI